VLQIDQPSLSLQQSVYLNTSDPMNAAVLADYGESVVQSARAIRDHLNSTISDDQIAQEVEQMIQFEVNLAEILSDPTGRYKDNRWNNLLRLHQLHDLTDEPIDTKPAVIQLNTLKSSSFNTKI
jgi:Peptidase family M13